MPNMFGSGPLKQTLKLLSREVWEGRLCSRPAIDEEQKWVGRSCGEGHRVNQVSARSYPVPAAAEREGTCCLKLIGFIQGPSMPRFPRKLFPMHPVTAEQLFGIAIYAHPGGNTSLQQRLGWGGGGELEHCALE